MEDMRNAKKVVVETGVKSKGERDRETETECREERSMKQLEEGRHPSDLKGQYTDTAEGWRERETDR